MQRINLDHATAMWIASLVLLVARNMQDMARDMTRQKVAYSPKGRCVVGYDGA